MANDGDMYTFSDHIRVEVNSAAAKKGYEDGWDFVQGCQPHMREPHDLAVQWVAPMQMAQVAPGHKWCSTCGDVRPVTYFDVLEWDMRGRATAWDAMNTPIAWDGIPFPSKWNDECKQCVNGRDPKLRPSKYCSGCKQEKRRAEYSPDERNRDGLQDRCKLCHAEQEREKYREIVGRTVRKYERQGAAV